MPKFTQQYTAEEFLAALGQGFKTAGYIAKKCGCSRGTSVSYLRDLEQKGLVQKTSVDDGQSNVWEINSYPLPECADEKEFARDWKLTVAENKVTIELTNRGACALLEDLNELNYCSKGKAFSRLIVHLKQSIEKELDELNVV